MNTRTKLYSEYLRCQAVAVARRFVLGARQQSEGLTRRAGCGHCSCVAFQFPAIDSFMSDAPSASLWVISALKTPVAPTTRSMVVSSLTSQARTVPCTRRIVSSHRPGATCSGSAESGRFGLKNELAGK